MALDTGTKTRKRGGTTVVELLVTCLLMGLTMGVIGELVLLNTIAATKMTNKTDAANSARWALERIASDVRCARSIGDHWSTVPSNEFPASVGDALYNPTPPSGGWPAAPWNSPPYLLSPSCLIIQQPVFFENPINAPLSTVYDGTAARDPRNGFPSLIKRGSLQNGGPLVDQENLDTIVYQVVPDPEIAGEFLVQVARFPGIAISNYSTNPSTLEVSLASPPINPPQTILKGLIGPLVNGSATPAIFSYFIGTGSQPVLQPPSIPTPPSSVAAIIGVATDLEIRKPDLNLAVQNPQFQETVALHTEAMVRSSKNITLSNFPP